ncbi:CRAL/TRIO domain-containing protein [Neocallimastix lanati (nom. inval.)]|nr:CRAL/TRIO domain-containing protein [Neocallimastix sp. JGI-2020a]
MIIPKVSIKNILSIDSNNEVNVKEQEKASSSSTKDYNKEECLSNLWIELISCLFDENPKISLKDLMAKKYSNNSYVERATSDELRKRSNSSSSNDSEISNNSTNSSTSKRKIFKIGRSSSPNKSLRKSNRKEEKKKVINNEPDEFKAEAEAILNSQEEIINCNAIIDLDSKEFKQKLWDCLFWTAGNEGLEHLLLRFIVARKGKVNDALKMLLNALIWRVTYDIEGLCKKGERIIDEKEFSCGKVYFYKYDKKGRFVTYIHVNKHIKDVRPQIETEKMTILSMETVRLILNKENPTACMVFDMSGFSMQNMDYGFILFLLNCFQNYYPEMLGVALIVGASWIFNGCWKIIKQLLDPTVVNKVRFIKDKSEIKNYIDECEIPECFGGTNKFSYSYIPYKEENDVNCSVETIEAAKRNWDIVKNKYITEIYEQYKSKLNVKLEDLLFKINDKKECEEVSNIGDILQNEISSSSTCSSSTSINGDENYDNYDSSMMKQIEKELYNAFVEYDKCTRSRTYYHRAGFTHY